MTNQYNKTVVSCIVAVLQFQVYHPDAELSWPSGMVDECDMDIDVDISSEVRCESLFFISKTYLFLLSDARQ